MNPFQSFIRLLEPSTADPLAAFIIDVGRRLGMVTVAEGVETAEQKALLETLGCDLLQGYLIAPPLTEAGYLAWMANQEVPAVAGRTATR